jgi:hypothetical protein
MAEISPLRRRMIEDMTVRNLSPATQQSYLNAVSKFGRYFGRSPDRLGLEDVHAFQVYLRQRLRPSATPSRICGHPELSALGCRLGSARLVKAALRIMRSCESCEYS